MNKTTAEPAYAVPAFGPARGSRSVLARLRRLRDMPLSEIAGRSRQEAAKLFERVTADRAVDAAAILRDHAPAYADGAAALEILRTAAPSRFFAGVQNLPLAAQAVPGHGDAVLSRAAATLQNRFDLLGY